MIDMDKMIEVVARQIFREMVSSVYPENVDLCERKSKYAAKAAIKAFCKELPEIKEATEPGVIKFTLMECWDKYHQLLEFGEDD